MQKKKILFVMESLGIGGAEKSLVTILSMLDKNKYDVDLFLFKQGGEFMPLVPEYVNVLSIDEKAEPMQSDFKTAWLKYLLKADIKRSFCAMMWLVSCAFTRVVLKKEYVGWNWIKHMYVPIQKKYDTVIGFMEKKSIYYAVDKVSANKKIGFIHNDYDRIEHDTKTDRKYFAALSTIPTVSEHCKEVLDRNFPEYVQKFTVIKNMISLQVIKKMSEEETGINKDSETTYICTVGRLVEQKGMDIAVQCCKRLVDAGYKIKWLVCGDGSEREKLEMMIKENGLEEKFVLLGAQTNPYKYMRLCDIYVQPSRFEGYGITVAEAKALGKAIVANNIPEFAEQLKNGETGLLYNSEEEMYEYIEKLISDKSQRDKLSENIKKHTNSESFEELKKLEDELNG